MEKYHAQSITQVLEQMKSNKMGLSTQEAQRRIEQYGHNMLPQSGATMTIWKIFWQQWTSPLILILMFAGAVSGFLREFIDMTVIFITVFLNVCIGFVQEFKANNALKKLNNLIVNKALVLRDNKKIRVDSSDIVPGDILLFDAGDKIQADGRIFESTDFEVNESLLTGESEPVTKHTKTLAENCVLGDRKNMVHNGTIVVNGRAQAVVVATGLHTQVGQIASLVQETENEETPLQKELAHVSKMIGWIVLGISIMIFALGFLIRSNYHSLFELFETAVAVAVAAIPEGLVISLTVILAIGMQYILKHKALVRKLIAAETLGSVSVICTDKTGTLTEGNMKVTHAVTATNEYTISEISRVHFEENTYKDLHTMLHIGVICNDGLLENPQDEEKKWKFTGDTTDTALISAGMHTGLQKDQLDAVFKRVGEIPFDSKNKYMATLHKIDHKNLLYVKGAPEVLYDMCNKYEENGQIKKMTVAMKKWFQKKEEILTSKGFRILAFAYKDADYNLDKLSKKDVQDLVFVGLIALSDPLREDVPQTISLAKKAGIRVIMITGDHVRTAQSIGRELGIPAEDNNIFNGEQLEHITDTALQDALHNISIFARVDPKHKIRIVRALQAQGEVVAMTGDGVNDAPALKGADIGIALGSGTDVAKEISDMVLLDDRFSTIVAAVEQGRGIYQNVKKVILYLLAGSFGEVVLVIGSLVAGLPLAVLPAQILWVNLIQDTFPNIALGFDKGDKDNMNEPPRRKEEFIIDKEMKYLIGIIVVISNAILFSLYIYFLRTTQNVDLTRTIMFLGLAINSLLYIYSVRSMRYYVWQINPFNNLYLNLALIFAWVMLVTAVYVPPLQKLLRTVNLELWHWGVMIGFGLLNMILIEVVKGIFLNKKKN